VKKERKIHSFIFLAVFMSALFFVSINLHAAEIKVEKVEAKPITFTPQITIPGSEIFKKGVPFTITKETMPTMARDLYKFLVGSAGMVAVIVMMAGGYLWIFAGGNTARVGQAKDYISGAVIGLTLALGSYMILNMINPDLINMKNFEIPTVPKVSITGIPVKGGVNWQGLKCVWAPNYPDDGGYIPVSEINQSYFCGTKPADFEISLPKQTTSTEIPPNCFCKITSECTAVTSGSCSVSNLEKYFEDRITAEMASRICNVESKGNEKLDSSTDKCYYDPSKRAFSGGLFQINVRRNSLDGKNCPNAFAGASISDAGFLGWMQQKFSSLYNSLKEAFLGKIREEDFACKIIDDPLYLSCINAAKTADINIKKAVEMSNNGTDWSKWGANSVCKFPPKIN